MNFQGFKFFLAFLLIQFSYISYAEQFYNQESTDYKSNEFYNFFIEIPAGTNEKWEVEKNTGKLRVEIKNRKKRILKFLPYPGNYGFIPQTLAKDGDPMDLIDIEASRKRGEVSSVKILGGLYFKDKNKEDIKFVGINPNGKFKDYNDLSELINSQPTIIEILRSWFQSYKKPGKMIFIKYLTKKESMQIIEEGHKRWKITN